MVDANKIKSELEKRAEALREAVQELEKRAEALREAAQEKVQEARDRRDAIQRRGDEAVHATRERIHKLEAAGLEEALELLGKVRGTLGERAAVLGRGEEALEELLVGIKAGQPSTLPVEGYDDLSIKNLLPQLDGLSATDLKVLRAYEATNKNRVTLLRKLDELIGAPEAAEA